MPATDLAWGGQPKWGNPFTRANGGPLGPAVRYACEVAPMLETEDCAAKTWRVGAAWSRSATPTRYWN